MNKLENWCIYVALQHIVHHHTRGKTPITDTY